MEPASRKQRFFAIALDCVFILTASAFASFEELPEPVRLVALAAGLGILATNLYLLAKKGQTLGKRLVGIKIAMADDGRNGGFVPNVLKRSVLAGLPYLVLMLIHPVLAAIYIWTDALFIFRRDRRCLHDHIAGTCVVEASSDVV